jgi:hypothetical protein
MFKGGHQAKETLILTGNVTHTEFAQVINWLRNRYVTEVVTHAANVAAIPQAILWFEGHPLQYAQAAVEQWAQLFPLTKLISIHGSWNEGETRSGFPLHGMTRLYWHELQNRLPVLLRNPLLPRTANFFDVCERITEKQLTTFAGSIAIAAYHESEYDSLADAALLMGLTPYRIQAKTIAELAPPTCWLWSGNATLQKCDFALFSRIKQHWLQAPGIAVMNFPRATEYHCLRNCGVEYLLSKPFLLSDFQQICQEILV